MSMAIRSAAMLACLAASAAGQARKIETSLYSIELPEGWRRMTPDESRRNMWPPDMERLLDPGLMDRFGPVDRWLAGSFDGTSLTVMVEAEGEPPMTAETLDRIREKFSAPRDGLRYAITPRLSELGPKRHPVIECALEVADPGGGPLARKLVYLVPTGGHTLWFTFRAAPADFAAQEPLFRRTAATITVSAAPRGPVELSDKLGTPLLVGGLVGLLLLVLYKLNRG